MVRFIIFLIIGVLALSYFGISIRNIVESPSGQDNLAFVWNIIQQGWVIVSTWAAQVITNIHRVFQ